MCGHGRGRREEKILDGRLKGLFVDLFERRIREIFVVQTGEKIFSCHPSHFVACLDTGARDVWCRNYFFGCQLEQR